jgi:tetratricopeptide (TPR) repeat protein
MKRYFHIGFALIFLLPAIRAFGEAGTSSANFLNLGTDARTIALGGAGTSWTRGTAALHWNPSGLAGWYGTEAAFTHAEHFQSIRYENLGWAAGRGDLGYGFALKGLYLSDLEERTGPAEDPLSTFGAYFLAPSFSFAKTLARGLACGATLKLVYQGIGADHAVAVAADVGVSYTAANGLSAGAALDNVGTKVRFVNDSYSLPVRFRGGLGFAPPPGRVRFAVDFGDIFAEGWEVDLGVEAAVTEKFFVRTGYASGVRENSGLSGFNAGLGLVVGDLNVDYAFRAFGVLGLSHHFSLTYNFGRIRNTLSAEERKILEELERRSRLTAQTFYQQGLNRERQGNFEDALRNYDIALVWDPGNGDALKAADAAKRALKEQLVAERVAQGIADFKSGNYFEAAVEFGAALENDPSSELAKGWLKAATEALVKVQAEKIILEQEQKNRLTGLLQNGLGFYTRQDYGRAIAEWNKALAISLGNKEARDYIARARDKIRIRADELLTSADNYAAQEDWLRALGELNRILNVDPQNATALAKKEEVRKKARFVSADHTRSGISLYKEAKYGPAETELKLALSYDETNITAQQYLAKIAAQKKNPALEDVNELYMKGVNAYTEEKYQLAVFYWKRVLEIDPANTNAKRNMARAEEKLKVYKK